MSESQEICVSYPIGIGGTLAARLISREAFHVGNYTYACDGLGTWDPLAKK